MDRESVERIAQERKAQTFPAIIAEMIQAIELCIQRRMFLAGQMLMYAGIDIMANFDRPEEKAEGTQQDFKRWAKTYMLDPSPHLQVNADDLYGARCGLLHGAVVESRKSRQGEARMIFAVIKPSPIKPLQRALDLNHQDDPEFHGVAVYLDELLQAFANGLGRFRADVESSPEKSRLVCARAGKVPILWGNEFLYGPR